MKQETSNNEESTMMMEDVEMTEASIAYENQPSEDLVPAYLSRIANAARTLARVTPSMNDVVDDDSLDCQQCLDRIAKDLLSSCRLEVLTLPCHNYLPKVSLPPIDLTQDIPRGDNDDGEESATPATWRRLDYLRRLLRAMAPIAMDVAARIASLLLRTTDNNNKTTTISQDHATAFWILSSVWLPMAPHLTPLASDVFALEIFPSPFLEGLDDNNRHQIFLLAEASHNLCYFFEQREEIKRLLTWWNWGPILCFPSSNLDDRDTEMMDAEDKYRQDTTTTTTTNDHHHYGFDLNDAIQWHVARIVIHLFQVSPKARGTYLHQLNLRITRVPWVVHPWTIDEEETQTQQLQLQGQAQIWSSVDVFRAPSVELVRKAVPLHPWLVHVGDGITFVKHDPISSSTDDIADNNNLQQLGGVKPSLNYLSASKDKRHNYLTRTATTSENLALLGAAMCTEPHPPPILVCGPHGSGKSSLVRELALILSSTGGGSTDQLLEIHVDEETDAKTLIGTYTMTDIPGEFTWKPGALTQAVRTGKWVLMEDIDSVPIEIQAALVKLLEDRVLPLGASGAMERCHPNFRLFGTCTTTSTVASMGSSSSTFNQRRGKLGIGAGKKILNSTLWRQVYVKPLPFTELKEISVSLFPNLPPSICDSALSILKALDRSGRESSPSESDDIEPSFKANSVLMAGGRPPSVRDFFKLLSRISNGIVFERNVRYATESQRTLCMAESVDIFLAACPDREKRRLFIRNTVAPTWGLTADLALSYLDNRRPTTQIMDHHLEVGRARLPILNRNSNVGTTRSGADNFTETSFSLRLMESIAVGIRENEPLLLVGETGCGKTSIIQHLAKYSERELIVQNLSLQTDSTDLLGGFRPLELQHVAQKVYQSFVDIFVGTFSRKQNAEFLNFAASALAKSDWKKLSQCFVRAGTLGLGKVRQRIKNADERESVSLHASLESWKRFSDTSERFERQRLACDSGLVFGFTEGALVDAIREGKWVLLDEINLASSEILQRLCGLLDDRAGSLTLTERGDAVAITRHPDFRLFAAMNPATDAGKKELHASIRSRFTEVYVDELLDPIELRVVSSRYLNTVLPHSDKPPEHSDVVISSVDVYLRCRELAHDVLVDGSGHKPRYTLRTLARAMTASKNLVLQQRLPLKRAIMEGFELALQGPLDANSVKVVQRVLKTTLGDKIPKSERDHPGRRPGNSDSADYVLIKPFWIKTGPHEPKDWSQNSTNGRGKFILTASAALNLRRLARAIAAGPWPILLEGPTSAGKTTLVEYIAARVGHRVVRINNHEHTDVQEYTGSFAPDSNGSLSFQDGILVRALKRGDWVILDELNLAPSEVLEALNRLLDDNRELYLPEINQIIRPHPNFRLFATQNPSGAYGGRKPLSRAFRNRFVELFIADIPSSEMTTILELRCGCPPSHCKALVAIMDALRQRRSKSGIFLGKDGLITPRDLLRWAERGAISKLDLARDGFMLLAERLRTPGEKEIVREEIEKQLKLTVNVDEHYYGPQSAARIELQKKPKELTLSPSQNKIVSSIAPTKSMLRLMNLIMRCIQQREPVLLVGDTGCGKTTVVELLSILLKSELQIVNCHATTETSDLIGGLRPVRGRNLIAETMLAKVKILLKDWPDQSALSELQIPHFVYSGDVSAVEPDLRDLPDSGVPDGAVTQMISLVRSLWQTAISGRNDKNLESPAKKQKLSEDEGDYGEYLQDERFASFAPLVEEIEELSKRYSSLFEWADGPVADAMKSGHMLLLDELSLAEDAVLERINSVLEPSRTLVLAEKGEDLGVDSDQDSRFIQAHDNFRIFATMNPGGDYGKKELSPALRSRFTEIWVPAVEDMSDIELVLRKSLASADEGICSSDIVRKMLAYVDWFNNSVCNDVASPYAGLSLSLRDVLAWVQFMIKARDGNRDLDLWEAYCHGAALMHLDGLGLGTGLAIEDTRALRARAQAFLLGQTVSPDQVSAFSSSNENLNFTVSRQFFGYHPFWIPTGEKAVRKSSFNFAAPRTAENIYRVLRAMQLPKPILLEGSPGVGKTSLVLALANAAGHRLVRINLSEQTDMSDLMGSDLPVPEKNSEGVMQASFKWCDGVLLRAIKNGDWVLLDELNLASQAVLEGLNSCLDYRANVFVPELGKTFQCPPTFRVFAAQNPMAQGGGRKGLPRSFLNRFTKVHVESLTGYDLRAIVSSKYPVLTDEVVDQMVAFNDQVHTSVVEQHEFGQAGSPWEFNLRDVFRWADLIVSGNDPYSKLSLARAARDIYLQRFRAIKDRDQLGTIYSEVFGIELSSNVPVEFTVNDQSVQVGDAVLDRIESGISSGCDTYRREPAIFRSLLRPMQAVARCIQMKWPCLLVGGAGSGKTSVLGSLSELCNATLVEVALSPSTDVNELIGCFEQVDAAAKDREILETIERIGSAYVLSHGFKHGFSHRVGDLLFKMKRDLEGLSDGQQGIIARNKSLRSLASALIEALDTAVQPHPELRSMCGLSIQEAREYLTDQCQEHTAGAHFQWVDGVLTRAMMEGNWLLLENVNLCSSSVLDRLNPVMETDGELLVAECGVKEDENAEFSHRVVKAHPNFRLFLSMDPEHGEVSRAMRNRCVEIALLQPEIGLLQSSPSAGLANISESFVDSFGVIWRAKLRSSLLAEDLLRGYRKVNDDALYFGGETPCIKTISHSAALGSSLLGHGLSSENTLRILSSVFSLELPRRKWEMMTNHGANLLTAPSFRSSWLQFPEQAAVDWDGRLLRLFLGWGGQLPGPLTLIPNAKNVFDLSTPDSESLSKKYKRLCPSLPDGESLSAQLRKFLAVLFLANSTTNDVWARTRCLYCHSDSFTGTFETLVDLFRKDFPDLLSTGGIHSHDASDTRNWELANLTRLPQKVLERVWYRRMLSEETSQVSLSNLRILDISFFMHEGRFDRSATPCEVTPVLFPLIQATDRWIDDVLARMGTEDGLCDSGCWSLCAEFLSSRDRLWLWMHDESPLGADEASFLAFDEAKFIVQWKWFKKSLRHFERAYMAHELESSTRKRSQMNVLIDAIDSFVFGQAGGGDQSQMSLWSKVGHPLVPRCASQWQAIERLRNLAKSCCVEVERLLESRDSVEVKDLIELRHPAFSVRQQDRAELLLAICMIHWSSTDEVTGEMRAKSLFSVEEACTAIAEQWSAKQREFMSQIEAMKIDESIDTVENQMSLEDLNSLASGAINASCKSDFSRITDRVLCDFGKLQLVPCSEEWCARKELNIAREISKMTVELSSNPSQLWGCLTSLVLEVRHFLDMALAWTNWPVSDLRPYQTLVWACESSSFSKESAGSLIRCLLPVISSATLRHSMAKYRGRRMRVSNRMEMPALFDTDGFAISSNHSQVISTGTTSQESIHAYAWIQTTTLLDLVGSLLSSSRSTRANTSLFASMENHRARAAQSRDFLRILSATTTATNTVQGPFEINYFLSETLAALAKGFTHRTVGDTRHHSAADVREMIRTRNVDQVRELMTECTHGTVNEFLEPVVFPLLDSLKNVWDCESRSTSSYGESLSLSFAYFGLLRFHLLLPDSPVDPGRKPLAKLDLLGSHLRNLRTQVTAIRLHSGFNKGDFCPDSPFMHKLLDDGAYLETKRTSQEKKIVERVANVPPFVDLFRESRDFAKNFCSKETALAMIGMLRNPGTSPSDVQQVRERIANWQETVGAFCDRLISHFGAYEDIVTPLVDSLRFLQIGLHDLQDKCLPARIVLNGHLDTVSLCLRYPMGDIYSDLTSTWETMQSLPLTTKAGLQSHRALGLGILSRFALRKLISGLDARTIELCSAIFASLVAKELESDDETKFDIDSENVQEVMFREEFPDHRSEFNSLLRREDDIEQDVELQELVETQVSPYTAMLSDEINKLCLLHRLLLSRESDVHDGDRVWAFREGIVAADNIFSAFGCPSSTSEGDIGRAGHVLAISLAASTNNSYLLMDVTSRGAPAARRVQFYRDPNPEEVLKASPAIEHLTTRLTQLLTAFPGNEVLLGIFKVADKVRKLDLHSTSVGKIMTGLEVILRHAQEWEQHASQRVQLGKPLQEVSQVVAMWRKLELQSWKDLLVSREDRFSRQARRHWTRLYKMLHAERKTVSSEGNLHPSSADDLNSQQWSPRWVWKGLAKYARTFFPTLINTTTKCSDLVELAKAMDTFMLTSPLGEYKERLDLIHTFSEQLLQESKTSYERYPSQLQSSRLLSSLWLYYREFSPLLASKLESLRAPIESKLRDQTKLAKWDEQSYYALAESTEKNHRNLMRCLREYDEVLDMNVGALLEQELNAGVRSGSGSQDGPCASIPSDSHFFPLIYKYKRSSLSGIRRKTPLLDREWANLSAMGAEYDSTYAGRMERYASKLISMLNNREAQATWSSMGKTNAHEFCATVFHRIESLRAGKASRQMKERAVVDLFKALKQNGYANTKWSIPKETQEMMQIFQLPSPPPLASGGLEEQSSLLLKESEDYCLRFISELRRFRSEADVLGSKYMTRRQTDMMLSFCEHGLLMISQQRCLLSALLTDYSALRRRVADLTIDGRKLPLLQNSTRQLLLDSRKKYLSAIENIKQLSLLIKVSRPLLPQGGASDWARETTTAVEALLMDLEDLELPEPQIVAERDMDIVAAALKRTKKALQVLDTCRNQSFSLSCFPQDAFDVCIAQLYEASSTLDACLGQSGLPQTTEAPAGEKSAESFVDAVSSAVKFTLLAVQGTQQSVDYRSSTDDNDKDDEGDEPGLWDCHLGVSKEWAEVNLKRLINSLDGVVDELRGQPSLESMERSACISLISDLGVLSQLALTLLEASIGEFIHFHRDSAKFHYILVRVFRMLVSKGYCSDEVADEDGGNDGDASGMNFEDDKEGTGMGEGDGKQDVTDQLENEEQLLGLEDDKPNEQEESNQNDRNQLNKEEAEQGMEMEGQFDGDMYDMPEGNDAEENDEEDGDEEEELDREMGLENDPNEQVVDEKMWEDSDDEKDMEQGNEKFEKNSSIKGAQDEDQVRTKEDDEDQEGADRQNEDNAEQKPASGENEDGDNNDNGDNESDNGINEDLEDNYEDNHGIDVREEPHMKEGQEEEQEQPMELDDNLELEDGENGENVDKDDENVDQEDHHNEALLDEDSQQEPEENEKSAEDDNEMDMQVPGAALNDDADAPQDENEENDEPEEPETEPPRVDLPSEPEKQNEGLGIRAVDGKDACQESGMEYEEDEGEGADGQEEMDTSGAPENEKEKTGQGGSGSGEQGNDGPTGGEDGMQNEALNEAPNPFTNPGDATRFWHQKLNMVDTNNLEESLETGENPSQDEERPSGEFEFASEQQNSTTQVLGEVAEDQAVEMEQRMDEDGETEDNIESRKSTQEKSEHQPKKAQPPKATQRHKQKEESSDDVKEQGNAEDDNDHSESEEYNKDQGSDGDSESSRGGLDDDDDDDDAGNKVVSDLSRLQVEEGLSDLRPMDPSLIEDEQVSGISSAEASEARARWSRIQGETHSLALRLCEKLRLVMEPLVASKLRGDYRTGKRINMKRVIGYIASGYRKDKIWLRRTKPAKRNYRVLLAVDDSESMLKCGTGEMALRAMATLAVGMSQLEIGELGVASFGDDMKLLHPFQQPFTTESGVDVVKNFKFDQPRTRTALCVESALSVLDTAGDAASVQLMFLISDGRIERDSRIVLKRLIREMMEKNILLAMIIVEGGDGERKEKKNDSILHMKEVTFEKGKPKVKKFIEDYPFPFYLIIDNMHDLPDVLGSALKQWFELLAHQSETR